MMFVLGVVVSFTANLLLAATAAEDTFFTCWKGETINLSELADSNYDMIGNATGTDALKVGLLQEDEDGFLCAQVIVKGNEKFHTHETADIFVQVMSGGGYFNIGDGTSINMPTGANILLEAGQPHEFFNKADPYTALVACFRAKAAEDCDSEKTPVDGNPGPNIDVTQDFPSSFATVTGLPVDLTGLDGPAAGESRKVHVLKSTAGISGMTVAAVVLATEESYHVHQSSSLWVTVVKGNNVVTASANDPEVTISVPEGSSIVFKKCEPHQFINLDGPGNPATLLAVFGPSLQSGDSVDVKDNPECLDNNSANSQDEKSDESDTSAATIFSTGIASVVAVALPIAADAVVTAFN
mmetsp:Transcript_17067/g.49003  ORF Transcript_17067/g.49003 Transcript_17067/m.49003 type:complete len:354 (+) Transcript_17067:30-1091(+)